MLLPLTTTTIPRSPSPPQPPPSLQQTTKKIEEHMQHLQRYFHIHIHIHYHLHLHPPSTAKLSSPSTVSQTSAPTCTSRARYSPNKPVRIARPWPRPPPPVVIDVREREREYRRLPDMEAEEVECVGVFEPEEERERVEEWVVMRERGGWRRPSGGTTIRERERWKEVVGEDEEVDEEVDRRKVRVENRNLSHRRRSSLTARPRFRFSTLRGFQQPELSKKLNQVIKNENAAIGAHEKASRERVSIASQLSEWGEWTDDDAVADITDKVAVLMAEIGEQEDTFAQYLEEYRIVLKQIRDTENSVQPSRDHRAKIADEIQKLKWKEPHSHKIDTLEQELVRAEAQSLVAEAQLTNVTRSKLKEALDIHTAAVIERNEKQILLARHARRVLELLDDTPVVPGDSPHEYDRTSSTRQILEEAENDLRSWESTTVPIQSAAGELPDSTLLPTAARRAANGRPSYAADTAVSDSVRDVNGSAEASYVNGAGPERYTNGTGVEQYANGTGQQRYVNGTGQERYANGTGQERYVNGNAAERQVNGTGREQYTNGGTTGAYANGGTARYVEGVAPEEYEDRSATEEYAGRAQEQSATGFAEQQYTSRAQEPVAASAGEERYPGRPLGQVFTSAADERYATGGTEGPSVPAIEEQTTPAAAQDLYSSQTGRDQVVDGSVPEETLKTQGEEEVPRPPDPRLSYTSRGSEAPQIISPVPVQAQPVAVPI
ncbi:sphingolipid long chain base-responsive protein PIL1 [Aspergillus awamori]|uniref:Sphingolipid long chain base-responsive protein PIL1 n=1 Tax=Aspergillus awamori TaxID=105351 RepID=A0A401KLV2_ASPAW|nr:sphingolipid long chain base-responsive protein PIL1 [Aspergillus awamori]